MLKTMCRTCGGQANPNTSSDLFAEEQRELLEYIKKTSNISIKPIDSLPTQICKNCETEVLFPPTFIRRCANAQYFFSTDAYREKLKLLEERCSEGESPGVNDNDAQDPDETDNYDTMSIDDLDSEESDDDILPADDFDEIPILTSKDILKPALKDKYGKPFKRQMYKCDKCDSVIIDRHNFITHMKRHLGLKPFKCKLCPNEYLTNSELKRHNYRHQNYRPYECQYCDASYFTKSSKDRHERVHTGEKPFICETCGKRFAGERNLNEHVKIHTGEKPYACLVCNKNFQRSYQLKVHLKSSAHRRNIQ